jgi:hypothetical protein
MKWEIYYDDETVVNDEDVAWHDCSAHGVLFVLEYLPNDKKMVHMGMDYYLMRDRSLMSFSGNSLNEHLLLGIDKGAIKFGRWAPNDVWERVQNKIFPRG